MGGRPNPTSQREQRCTLLPLFYLQPACCWREVCVCFEPQPSSWPEEEPSIKPCKNPPSSSSPPPRHPRPSPSALSPPPPPAEDPLRAGRCGKCEWAEAGPPHPRPPPRGAKELLVAVVVAVVVEVAGWTFPAGSSWRQGRPREGPEKAGGGRDRVQTGAECLLPLLLVEIPPAPLAFLPCLGTLAAAAPTSLPPPPPSSLPLAPDSLGCPHPTCVSTLFASSSPSSSSSISTSGFK